METKEAVGALAALAQESRLRVFRLLVEAGPEGLAPTDIAARLDIPAPTLSFHLKSLSQAGLVSTRQEGRYIYYAAQYAAMEALLEFLTQNCCQGSSCLPARSTRPANPPVKRRSSS